jgi:hypothetical protein
MTMHLVRGLSSINTKKRKVKRKPGWREAEAQHEKWLRKLGAHPDQLKSKKKEFEPYAPSKPYVRHTESYPSLKTSDVIPTSCAKPDRKEYSGDYIVGIATMHKSNLVPVGRGDNPEEYAKMRRG